MKTLKYFYLFLLIAFAKQMYGQDFIVKPGEYKITTGTILYSLDSHKKIEQCYSNTMIEIIKPLENDYYFAKYKGKVGAFSINAIDKVHLVPYTPSLKIKSDVVQEYEKWLIKGEFEKTKDYKQRISPRNRDKKLQEITEAVLEKHKANFLSQLETIKPVLNEYDADNEIFKLNFRNDVVFLKVPISEAKRFKESFNNVEFSNFDISLNNSDSWVISKFTARHQSLKKDYIYDNSNEYSYVTKDLITVNVKDVDINIPKIDKKSGYSSNASKNIIISKPEIHENIPLTKQKRKNTFCLIIGNEDYSSRQSSLNKENDVPFALNDAKYFSIYANKTLGIPEENIEIILNATKSEIMQGIYKLNTLSNVKNGKAELVFYYAGHGLPEEQSKEQYLIPVDVSSSNINFGVSLNKLIKILTEYNPEKVTLIIDACFSGGARNKGLLATRGVKIKPKESIAKGNVVVLASSSGSESSNAYQEKQHGMFTYFLLKKLQDTKGNVTYGELFDYMEQEVKLKSVLLNDKLQTPKINVSPQIYENWETWKF